MIYTANCVDMCAAITESLVLEALRRGSNPHCGAEAARGPKGQLGDLTLVHFMCKFIEKAGELKEMPRFFGALTA